MNHLNLIVSGIHISHRSEPVAKRHARFDLATSPFRFPAGWIQRAAAILVALFAIAAFPQLAQAQAVQFAPPVQYGDGGGGGGPHNVILADFNGDGILDMALVDTGSFGVAILLGNGDGTFRYSGFYGTDPYPGFNIAAGDFNGDGFLDLAVPSNYGPTPDVDIFFGNGDGTFQPKVPLYIGGVVTAVAVQDLNGDGHPDLVVTNAAIGSVFVLLGNGDGTFQAPVAYNIGAGSNDVAIADINGDGKPDIVVPAGGGVDVLLGNGDGTFQPAIFTVTYDGSYTGIAIGDFNGDGKPDVAILSYASAGIVTVLLGNGDGTFATPVNYPLDPANSYPEAVAVADFTGNGILDLAVTNATTANLSVLVGNGDGTFQPAVDFMVAGYNSNDSGIAVADLNGDGKPDVVISNYNDNTVSVLLNTSPPLVTVPNIVGQTQGAATTSITGAGLVVGTVNTASSNTVPSGSVISESPAAGTQVNVGWAINLVVSTGPAQVAVPNVVGQTQGAATTSISGAGLVVGTVNTASSNTVPSGSVISESPAPGTLVNVGSAVNLVVSTGPAQVAVPNVVGQTQGAATTSISGAGLVVGTVGTASSNTVPSGSVISESPAPGTLVNLGSAVNLVVSTGPAQVAVPNVVGQTQGAATTSINGAGLVVGTVGTASSNTVPSGSVISESPAPGTLVNLGSAVNLVVSTGPAQYLLTTAANPSAGGTVSPATGNHPSGAVVSLKATPNPGYVFSNWTGSAVANANSASTTITMSGPESVTANFVPAIAVSPSSLSFGTVYLGSITTNNVIVTNTGIAAITMNDPFLSIVSGGDSSEFIALNLCPRSLAAGSSCTITIFFIAGPFFNPQTATLSVMDSAPNSPQNVSLTAQVIDPQAQLSVINWNFGTQKENTSSSPTPVTLVNTGATALTINSIAIAGRNPADFNETNNCPASLAVKSSCTIYVTFKPLAKGSLSGSVVITDNAWNSPQSITLSGTGN
jgi:beta-lactam-binding protein with PASTA domain